MTAVVEHGSLSAAAKELYVTVQAVSKAIADLERELGQRLFVRESRGVTPTPFGLAFYEKASGVMASFDELEAFARRYNVQGNLPERLRLALNTPAFPGNELVRENTALFIRNQAGIEVTNDLATGPSGFEALRKGKYDALITVGTFNHSEVDCRAVGTVPAGVMMGKNHPLEKQELVALSDIAPYPIALSSWFDSANDTIVEGYRERNANLNFVALSLDGVFDFLYAGGLIFTTGIPALGRMHPLVTVRLMTPEDTVMVPICVVSLKNHSAMVNAVVERLLARGGASAFGLNKISPDQNQGRA